MNCVISRQPLYIAAERNREYSLVHKQSLKKLPPALYFILEGEIRMESWLFYALLSAGSAALVSIFGKVGLQGIDSNAATAVRSIIMGLFLVGVVAVQGNLGNLSTVFADKKALLFIALSGIAGATSWLFYFLALKVGKVSQVAPIDKLSVVFAVILAMIIFGERVSFMHGLAIAMIAAGGLILAIFN